MLEQFSEVAKGIAYSAPQLPVLSNLTGELLTPEQATDPAYWVSQVREPVRFADGAAHLAEQGVATCLELGPDGVLCAMAAGSFAAAEKEAVALPLLRKDRPEAAALLGALAGAQANGVPLDWARLFAGQGASRVPLPTYAFQRQRYWLEWSAGGDASAIGQNTLDHPLLGAATSLPGEAGWLLTGRLSLQTHPWLADHRVHGSAILPGTAFVEMALKAAEQSGAEAIEELTLDAPLILPEQGAVQVQVSVGEADEAGNRSVQIHSRPEDADDPDREWVANAAGVLGAAGAVEPEPLAEWPPEGAEPLEVDSLYELSADLGLDYGSAFQGVKAAWRRGEELFAEVELDEEQASQGERFGIHPALLDAALHTALLDEDSAGGALVPFAWSGVRLHRAGAAKLRVALTPAGHDTLALRIADAAGAPLASVGSLASRPLPTEALAGAAEHRDSLFAIAWTEQKLPAGQDHETRVVECSPQGGLDAAAAAKALCEEVLATLQEAISAAEETRIAFLTEGAVAVGAGESPDPAAASVWGLVRSAQAEHPGRFLLIDTDGREASEAALASALAIEAEPQLALREGAALAARLARAESERTEPKPLDPEATVLVTGASGGLGALFARHLVVVHGARHLLLASRRGPAAPGAKELAQELSELGAAVDVVACDVAERPQLAQLLDSIPAEHPLGAVVHAAGVLDDGVVESLTPERLQTVMAPKAAAAWNLHELTRELELSDFVLFSSAAATFGGPGQANYAAANSFLDALAQQRTAQGLPASSLAWGAWALESGMTGQLGEAERARMARGGIEAIADAEGLALFERSRKLSDPFVVAAPLQPAALRSLARAGELAPLFAGLVRVPARRSRTAAGSLGRRLAEAPAAEREDIVIALVAEHVAAVLGHASGEAIDPGAAFKDLGFDSLAAVELRNRLGEATGLRLPSTLVFDYPSAAAAASFLQGLAEGQSSAPAAVRSIARSEEPIAIVGISCRYPGGVTSPEGLWQLLASGGDGISAFPEDRGWPLDRLFDPDPDHAGTSYVSESGFLHDAGEFDAGFFGISPREALAMDPQQRLLLEAAWEAFEDAGIAPASLQGTATGVFAGLMHHAYGQGAAASAELEAFQSMGSTGSIVSGRVAYAFGLEGPAMTVDTACSSSLIAMHLAGQALRSGECSLALAGGVTVMPEPTQFVEYSRQRSLAADARCKPFAAAADGTGWSEGVGLVVLERLSEARRNGHEVLALIRGSATNQDGASNGLTAPNGPSQEKVIRQALANAGLEPSEVDAVEAHGTGTTLGDPIEAQALLATYGQDRGEAEPLRLGAIKSNIGHTQAAAGVAGVIKMTMAMRHGVLPKTLHLDEPTPHVDWDSGAVELLGEAQPWERGERPRRAGVSSFGISGTNAHLILEEAPAKEVAERTTEDAGGDLGPAPAVVSLPLSAKGGDALHGQAARLINHLQANPDLDLADVGYSLATSRDSLEHRATAIGADREELLGALAALAAGKPHPGLIQGRATQGKLAFVFPGQGSQWQGMARALLDESTAFAEQIGACAQALDPFLDFSVEAVLRGDEGAPGLDRVDVVQPALFATMVALARLWQLHGVQPRALLGHSQGEIAAAHLAGALSLDDAARVVALRSRALTRLAGEGGMVSVAMPSEETLERIEPWGRRLSLAAVNGPASTVVSGEPEALRELLAACEADSVRARAISVDYASHSPQIELIREQLLSDLAPIEPRPAEIPFYSAMSAGPLEGRELGPEYWYRSLREPVRFEPAVRALLADGFDVFVETSPHPVLTLAVQETAEAGGEDRESVATIGSLRRDEGGFARFTAALAEAQAHGAALDWRGLFAGRKPKRVPLPTYAFQRKRYWLESAAAPGDAGAIGQSSSDHPLLGAAISLPGEAGWLLTGRLSLQTHPWLGDHRVHGSAILPGTAFVEMALKAAEQAGAEAIEELTIEAPLILPERGAVQVQVSVGAADEAGSRSLRVHSRLEDQESPDSEWITNADGVLGTASAPVPAGVAEWPPSGARSLDVDALYERAAELGIDYGPAFQGVKAAWSRGEDLFAEVELGEDQASQAERFGLHPALLDAALHASLGADGKEGEDATVPFAWSGVQLYQAGAAKLRVALTTAGDDALSLRISDCAGEPLVGVGSLAVRPLPAEALSGAAADEHRDSLFAIAWAEQSLPEPEAEGPEVVALTPDPSLDPAAAAKALCEQVLATLQDAIASGEETRIAFLTEGAVAVGAGESPDPAAASVWGLVRSAQAEHPGRFLLIDTDGSEVSEAALAAALAIESEPQLALREGAALAARLVRADTEADEPQPLDPEATVLITGATGTLGALFARHLVVAHGARHLLLSSRRGAEAPGALELAEELSELGAAVDVVACDVAERSQLAQLLDSIPQEHPLGAVVHAAGVLDDGVVESLTPERLATVMAPKAAAAWNLHELTRELELSDFVLFSSIAGSFGGPGQGNYAAANCFLDALAQQRSAEGLPASSIAWGPWEQESEMTRGLGETDRARMVRVGGGTIADANGLELFERIRGLPFAIATPLEIATLRSLARSGELAPFYSGLVRVPARRAAAAGGSLAQRLAEAPAAERQGIVETLVAEHVAAVLGHASGAAIDTKAAFKDLGFDSLGAVELRNRLNAATGLRLPSTLVFDYPSAAAAASFLRELAEGESSAPVAVRASARSEEPIAIVGMSCRYPGGAKSPEGLWRLLTSGADAISSFPEDRGWDLEHLFDPDPDHSGTSYASTGGFLGDAAEFDAEFFGFGPREARATDPQQRLLLEAAWEALEDGGLDPASLAGSATGVFAGVMLHGYGLGAGDETEGTISGGSVVSGRIAYSLGLEGPAVTVDTACSSSLVAMHLAGQSLRSGECDLALAGGVSVMAEPTSFVEFSRQRGLAADGRCKPFAGTADGTGLSEGVGLVVLERLSDARRNGHEVLALVRGSATNQDGASNGPTAPNGPSQEKVIRQALANAGLSVAEVDAVEAHGTGTTLGDPIEAQALLATYGQDRGEAEPLRLGAIKSNLGHTQAAAGVAGVIKMALAMRHGVLPKTLHLDEPSPHVDWDSGAVELLGEAQPWEPNGHPRRAGVSSFGISGTNAHLILEEAPAPPEVEEEPAKESPLLPVVPLPLSAKGEDALREQAVRLVSHLQSNPDLSPADVGFSLATTRATLEHRATVLGADREELLEALAALGAGKPHPGLVQGKAATGKLAFLFSGQGAQRPGMGKELYRVLPDLRHRPGRDLRRARSVARPLAEGAPLRQGEKQEGRPARPHRVHPAGSLRSGGSPLPPAAGLGPHPRLPARPLDRRAVCSPRRRRLRSSRRLQADRRQRRPDGRPAGRWSDGGDRGRRGGDLPRSPRRPLDRRHQRPRLGRRLRSRGSGSGAGRALEAEGPQNDPPASQPRLPLRADGADARAVL